MPIYLRSSKNFSEEEWSWGELSRRPVWAGGTEMRTQETLTKGAPLIAAGTQLPSLWVCVGACSEREKSIFISWAVIAVSFYCILSVWLFFLKKIKQTNKSLFSVRVNPTMHECIQIINWPGSNFSLVPERRQKPRVPAQITRDCQQAGPSISPGGQGGKACGCTGVSTSVFVSTVTCWGVGVKEAGRHALLAPHSH